MYGALLSTTETAETAVVPACSGFFDKEDYILKLSQKKWRSFISSILLAASASSFLLAPVYAAEYTKPLIGTVKKDSEILSPDGNTVQEVDGTITYDFQGKDHTFTITNRDGITAKKDSVYSNVDSSGKMGTLHLYQSNTEENPYENVTGFVAAGGKVVVNSNLDITATSEYSSAGITAANQANVIINGNVKMRKDNTESPWGIITDNVHGNVGPGGATSMDNGYDANYTGARWNPTGISITGSQADITVNGDVDIAVRGTAIKTDPWNSVNGVNPHDLATISLLGNYTRIDTPHSEKNSVEGFGEFIEPYYSLASYGGTINVNVKNLEAQSGKVEIVGNVLAMKTSAYTHANYLYQDGRINLGLTTADSYWKGIIDNTNLNRDVEDKTSPYGYKYDPSATPVNADHSGEVNLWLQNGAQWIYENASRKDGLDYSNMPQISQSSYGNYDGISHLSKLVGGKNQASAGIITVKDSDPIHIANAEGVTKVWYDHADATPGTIIGGDVKVFSAKEGTEMMLYTGNNGINKGFAEGDTAAEKNNVSEVLNSLAHKLWYMAGDSNLKGSVTIADGLTASSSTLKMGNITFAEGGQGFYAYTPEKDDKTYATGAIVKSENIDETRESDVNGVVSINVTESQTGVSGEAPSALYVAGDAASPLVVDLQGHTLKLNANNQTANHVSTVFVDENKSMEIKDSKGNGVLKISAGLGADGNADTKAKYVYGIRVGEGGSLTADTDVEIDGVKSNSSSRAFGVYAYSEGNVVFEKDLTIKNVQTANKVGPYTAGIYADASSSAKSPINITVKGNLNIENVLGSAIRVMNSSTVSTAGATIKAPDMSNGTEYSQYFALQANKGTINLNTGEGITAGILDVTGDMKVTNNKASVINVNMTNGSQWTGAVSNIPSSTYNAPDGQFNLTMADGSVWNHETGRSVDTLKATFAGSNVSKLDGSGLIYQNSDKGITVYNYSGDTTVVYGHDATNPQNITGGDFTVKTAAAGSKITLVTDSQGITGGFDASDTAAEKNNVKEVLNKLANKLFYTGYKDANLSGMVKIADGLTASSVSASVKASGDITFSDGSNGTKKAGQGFYAYTPEEDKPDYKTGAITTSENISLNRELDANGVAHVSVTESNAGNNKFASALYAVESTSSAKPMTVNLAGKGLALNAAQTSGQAAAIYAGANAYINVVNKSADQKLAITANNTDTRGSHGIYADGSAHLNISGPVEITDVATKGDAATGINIQGKQSEINIDGSLTISNVKGIRERGAGMNAAGILVTGDTSSVTVSGPVDISNVRGSGILLKGKDTKVSVGGGTITAAEDSDKSHNFYAVRVEKGTLDINMKDGAAGDTTTKITGDMYATGQYGKKVVEYTGGELIDWNDAGVLNVALTDKDSFWKGVAAYDMYNDNYGSGGNTAHDIGQFNLYLQNGATWTNEQQSHVTTTTIASKNPVWEGSTLATLHGGKDAANAGLIYQKDNNPISVVNYSGHTTVFYEHDAADPTKIIGGDFNITKAEKGSAITFITDNKGITSGWNDSDAAEAKDNVASVLNSLAGKLFYHNYTDGNLQGVVKIADGLTASSAALKTGDISFSTDATGTKNPGQGYYDYKPSGEKPEYKTGAVKESEDISKTREADANGVVNVKVTEPTITEGYSKFAAALYADDPTASMNVKMAGKDLVLSSVVEEGAQAAGIFVDKGANITIANPFVKQKLAITATNNDTRGAHGIYADGSAHLNISGPVEITDIVTQGDAATGINIQGQKSEINIDGSLTISNVKGSRERGAGINAAGIMVTGDSSTVTVSGPVDISGVRGSGIKLTGKDTKVSVVGGTITAAEDSDKSHNYYAARVEKGTLDINMKDGAAGSTTTKIAGDMYATGQYGKKVVEYTGGELIDWNDAGVLNVALTDKDSFWKGVAAYDQYNSDYGSGGNTMHDIGQFNLYLQNGAAWTNEQQSHVTTTTVNNAVWEGSTLASLHGGKDAANAGLIYQKDDNPISVVNYSGYTTVFYEHDTADPTKIIGGDFNITNAEKGSAITFITDNKGITSGFTVGDAAEAKKNVVNVLNSLAGKLFYKNYTDGNLKGVVKIAGGLTASDAALKTGDISFSTETTGTKTPGQGYYEYDEVAENTFNAPITGGTDKKYTEAGIEKEKGVYTFTNDAVIDVTKGDYSSNLGAIESSGGPVTINADGLNLDVSYHVTKGSNVARAVATGLSYGKSRDVTIKAKSLKLSTDTTGFYGQGVYAAGGKITIDADTTISTSAQNESNGIYSGSGATVNMNGSLDIKKDSKAANYIALKSDANGVINVNIKDGKAGAGIVKIDGDVYTKSAESYDYWEDETTTTSSTVNLALQGADSTWNGRSIYEAASSGDDSTSYGSFNLWLTDGASWTNAKNGKSVPSGFAGSHVTSFVGGADAAHAGHIFQNDTNSITIDKYSGNTNIFYTHTGNGEAASDFAAGDTVIKHATAGSVVSMITDNSGISMDNEYSVANVLNNLAGKLTYSNFTKKENNLTGYVKIADGLTASSAAMQTGNIAFNAETGKGSLENGSLKPGFTYPETQKPGSNVINQGITGNAKDDYQLKMDGILKEDGSYVFTQDPTKIEVESGAAVDATDKDIVIDTTKAKLELKGASAGINTNGNDVTVKGNTEISGVIGINADKGNITLNGSTNVTGNDGKGVAINASNGGNVTIDSGNSAVNINGKINADNGSIMIDSGNATGKITGDVKAVNKGSVEISLNDKNSLLKGGYKVDGSSSIVMNIKNGATWEVEDYKETPAAYRMARASLAPAAPGAVTGLIINGGATEGEAGNIKIKSTSNLDAASWSGWENVLYTHKDKGANVDDYVTEAGAKAGNVIVNSAKEGSGLILFTDNTNINVKSKTEVEAALTALAQKAQYTDHAANGANLKGKLKIAEGLTSVGVTGEMKWNPAGIGEFDPSSIKWSEIIEGDYETLVMQGVRSAATTSMHTWRDNMQDTYTGADLADADGIFAKALGGKTSSDVHGLRDSNNYRGVQVGFDKAVANGWHAGVAFDYRDGDSNYLLGGKGDNQMYSFGVYGVKSFADQSYLRVAAKAGRVENEYDVYNEIRSLKLHGDYKSNAYGLTMEYGKTFGTETNYFTPKAQLTWSQVGSKDYAAHTPNDTMYIGQDAYSSFVGRLGVEAGMKSAKGSVYVGLFAAHEFNGDISASYFAKDGGKKYTSFDGKDTWMEMKLGGTYDFSNTAHLYADIAKDFGGDFERKWKLNAGVRFEF